MQVRDLVSWMHDMEETICSEEPARSVSGAEALISKHNEHKAEIDARHSSVTQVSKAGRKMIQQNHYASAEVCIFFLPISLLELLLRFIYTPTLQVFCEHSHLMTCDIHF